MRDKRECDKRYFLASGNVGKELNQLISLMNKEDADHKKNIPESPV